MLVVVWEYPAKPERVEEFASSDRPDGPWGELFRDSPAFISTTTCQASSERGRRLYDREIEVGRCDFLDERKDLPCPSR